MLRTYSKDIQVAANTAIPFNIVKFDLGDNIAHTAGSSDIIVRRPGFYEVNLDISFTTEAAPTTQPVSVQLFANGVAIPDAIISTNITATENTNASFNTIIRALPGVPYQNVTLTVVPTNDITISTVSLGIDQ
jgi:hypothetical protein